MGQFEPAGSDVRLSGSTAFVKFWYPVLFLSFVMFWFFAVSFMARVTPQNPPRFIRYMAIPMLAGGIYQFCRYHLPLRDVWLTPNGLLVKSIRTQNLIPYDAVASVREKFTGKSRYVEVRWSEGSASGRRFTFLPLNPRYFYFGPPSLDFEDDVVIALREQIESAHKSVEKSRRTLTPAARSVMADDELDGPF